MKAKFIYQGKNLDVQFNKNDKAKDVINHFINKTFLDLNDLNFKYNNKKINPELTLCSQLNLLNDVQEIEINVEKKVKEVTDSHIANVNINGVQEQVVVPKGKSVLDVLETGFNFFKKRAKKLLFLYNGKIIDENDRRKSFNQVANADSKERNVMDIVAIEMEENEEQNENDENKEELKLLPNDNQQDDNIQNELEEKNKDNDNDNDDNSSDFIMDYTDSYKFFFKFNGFLFLQQIIILGILFIIFYYNLEGSFSKSSSTFSLYTSVISIITFFCSLGIICMRPDEEGKIGYCKKFVTFFYVELCFILCCLLSMYKNEVVIEKKYIFFQLVIFALDYLFSIIYNLIFKIYRGWVLLFILAIVNIIAIFIYYIPISNNYDNIKLSYGGFVAISVISSIMLLYIIVFNNEILEEFKIDITGTHQALYAVSIFNYMPFLFILCVALFVVVLALLLAIIGIVIALIIIILVLYVIIIFISSLFTA